MSNSGQTQLSVRVRNRQRLTSINVVDLEKFAAEAVRCCLAISRKQATELTTLDEVCIWLISDRRMAELHRRFLNKSGPTDVLTFQHGEIFIAVQTARRNARKVRTSLGRELRLYIAHGLLHLHGFNDLSKVGARKMKAAQEKIVRLLR